MELHRRVGPRIDIADRDTARDEIRNTTGGAPPFADASTESSIDV